MFINLCQNKKKRITVRDFEVANEIMASLTTSTIPAAKDIEYPCYPLWFFFKLLKSTIVILDGSITMKI